LSGDDTVIAKPYSDPNLELIGYFWSGLHHRPIKGINLITLYTPTQKGISTVNYRIYNKQGARPKTIMREMIEERLGHTAKDCDWRRLVFKPGKPEIFEKTGTGFSVWDYQK